MNSGRNGVVMATHTADAADQFLKYGRVFGTAEDFADFLHKKPSVYHPTTDDQFRSTKTGPFMYAVIFDIRDDDTKILQSRTQDVALDRDEEQNKIIPNTHIVGWINMKNGTFSKGHFYNENIIRKQRPVIIRNTSVGRFNRPRV